MEQTVFQGMEHIVQYCMPIAEAAVRSGCLYWFVKPFVRKRRAVVYGAAASFLTVVLFYVLNLSFDMYVIYGMASLVLFSVLFWADRRNYRQKLFLVATFFSFSWLAAAMSEILYDHLYDYGQQTGSMLDHPELWVVLYVVMCLVFLAAEFAFIAIGICLVIKVYANKSADMEGKELMMLALPSLMGVMGFEIMRYYRTFYAAEIGRLKYTYDVLQLLFCAMSMATIIVVIILYQDIKAKQEETLQTKLLAAQIENIKQHIGQVESLYRDIRGVKHDMTNHVLTLERLYAGNMNKEAKAYSEELKAELAEMGGEVKSGNPVTDVILQEFKKEAERRGISFCTEFYFPADSAINVFDISVILNNALQNALENTQQGKERKIYIESYRKNNAYMIEIRNSFAGDLQWDEESGLPLTTKEDKDGHGYGLSNIRRVAKKYAGDIDIIWKEGEFCLCIMLMAE